MIEKLLLDEYYLVNQYGDKNTLRLLTVKYLELPQDFSDRLTILPEGVTIELYGEEFGNTYLLTLEDDASVTGQMLKKRNDLAQSRQQIEEEYEKQTETIRVQISELNKQLYPFKKKFKTKDDSLKDEIKQVDKELSNIIRKSDSYCYRYEETREHGIEGEWDQ